ncbi:hypothetical protein GCM10020256_66300 [Streptomyces thermocoprophilus]
MSSPPPARTRARSGWPRGAASSSPRRARTARSPWTSPPPRSPGPPSPTASRRHWAPSRAPPSTPARTWETCSSNSRTRRRSAASPPDLKAIGAYSSRGIIATARAEDPSRGYDFVSRCFFPNLGIDEDPVTGSAHTALAPYWSPRLGSAELTGLQASPRSGRVRVELRGDRTLLSGRAVTVIDGELLA